MCPSGEHAHRKDNKIGLGAGAYKPISPKVNMGPKKPDHLLTSNLELLESFKKNFSDAFKVALEEGQTREVEVFRACILQVQAQIDDLKAEKPTE